VLRWTQLRQYRSVEWSISSNSATRISRGAQPAADSSTAPRTSPALSITVTCTSLSSVLTRASASSPGSRTTCSVSVNASVLKTTPLRVISVRCARLP
jgi:hypothetical protein